MQAKVRGIVRSAFKPDDSSRCFVKMLDLDTYGDFKFSMEQSPPPADLVGTKTTVFVEGEFEGADRGQRGFALHASGAVSFVPEGAPTGGSSTSKK